MLPCRSIGTHLLTQLVGKYYCFWLGGHHAAALHCYHHTVYHHNDCQTFVLDIHLTSRSAQVIIILLIFSTTTWVLDAQRHPD